jgi:CRP-like cAMP-binding protein
MLRRRPATGHDAANASSFGPSLERWLVAGIRPGGMLERLCHLLCGDGQQTLALSMDHALRVAGYMRPYRASAGEVLIQEGDRNGSTDLLVIIEGHVHVHTRVDAGGTAWDLELCPLGPGDMMGALALLDADPRQATCKARTDVVGATLSRGALAVLGQDQPAIAARFMATVCQRLAQQLRHNNRLQAQAMERARHLQDRLGGTSATTTPP